MISRLARAYGPSLEETTLKYGREPARAGNHDRRWFHYRCVQRGPYRATAAAERQPTAKVLFQLTVRSRFRQQRVVDPPID